jgi:DNA-directed RNA polymerase subunit RPC12/RpoP
VEIPGLTYIPLSDIQDSIEFEKTAPVVNGWKLQYNSFPLANMDLWEKLYVCPTCSKKWLFCAFDPKDYSHIKCLDCDLK